MQISKNAWCTPTHIITRTKNIKNVTRYRDGRSAKSIEIR